MSGYNRHEAQPRVSSNIRTASQHELQTQETIAPAEIIDSISSAVSDHSLGQFRSTSLGDIPQEGGDIELVNDVHIDDMGSGMASVSNATVDQPTLEQIQRVYYTRGLEELENLHLLDLSPLANWKLSSYKQGCGLSQLLEDSPDSLWQSDGSNGTNNVNASANGMNNNQLANPHSVTIQFAKKISLERISIFTNFTLDESYTPSKIRIMAGSSGWDLSEVCTVNFSKPIGWSHIIFNGIRTDGVLKCFVVKLIVLANHQDGKDSHIRAIRCFGKKTAQSNLNLPMATSGLNELSAPFLSHSSDIEASAMSGLTNTSGLLLSHGTENIEPANEEMKSNLDDDSSRVLGNVSDVIGFNAGFQSIELKSISSIR